MVGCVLHIAFNIIYISAFHSSFRWYKILVLVFVILYCLFGCTLFMGDFSNNYSPLDESLPELIASLFVCMLYYNSHNFFFMPGILISRHRQIVQPQI